MSNYTEGDWQYTPNADWDIKTSKKPIALLARPYMNQTVEEYHANGQLISASPDMYEALKAVLAMPYDNRHHNLCYGIDIKSHPDCETCKILKILRRVYGAIAKAEGKC